MFQVWIGLGWVELTILLHVFKPIFQTWVGLGSKFFPYYPFLTHITKLGWIENFFHITRFQTHITNLTWVGSGCIGLKIFTMLPVFNPIFQIWVGSGRVMLGLIWFGWVGLKILTILPVFKPIWIWVGLGWKFFPYQFSNSYNKFGLRWIGSGRVVLGWKFFPYYQFSNPYNKFGLGWVENSYHITRFQTHITNCIVPKSS